MIIENLILKRKIKKFDYLFEDTSFLNSDIDLKRLLEYIKSASKILEDFYEETRKRYIVHFQSYESIYENYNEDTFLEKVKVKIRDENDSRRNLFYNFLNGNTIIDNSIYHDLCNVSKEFADSFFKATRKSILTVNSNSHSWFKIFRNNYILDILFYFEHHSYIKSNYTFDIRKLEEKLLEIVNSNYTVESWSSSVAYLCELEDLEERSIFGSNFEIQKEIYDKIRKYLFRDASDKYFMSLEDAEYYSRRL